MKSEATEVLELAHAACSGDLSETQMSRLEELLSNLSLLERYVTFMEVEGLLECSGEVAIQARRSSPAARPWLLRYLAASAALIFVVGFAIWSFVSPYTIVVARVSAMSSGTIAEGRFGRELMTDSPVRYRETVEVVDGLVECTLAGGTKLRARGPCRIQLMEDACRLLQGEVVGHVPPGQEGFRVITDEGVVTDLGTTFSVLSDPEIGADVQVLDGVVDVTGSKGNLELKQSSAARLGRADAGISAVPFSARSFVSDIAMLVGVDQISGEIFPFDLLPPRLAPGEWESSDGISLFMEKLHVSSVGLPEPDLMPSGVSVQESRATHVDSYLFHFDPPDNESVTVQGSVTFAKPIVGVFCAPEKLLSLDPVLARIVMDFPREGNVAERRGAFWDTERKTDRISFRGDGHTIDLTIFANGAAAEGLDQVRVIVESSVREREAG